MSDSWSSITDSNTESDADIQSQTDKLLQLRDRVTACIVKLDAKKYSATIAEEISKELLQVRQQITEFECGLQFAKDLAVTNQLVATQADHRSIEVIRSCLRQFAEYLAEVAQHGVDRPSALLIAFNELFALQKKPLLTDSLFSIPDTNRVDVTRLQLANKETRAENSLEAGSINSPEDNAAPVSDRYLGFSQTMLGVYRGESREKKLVQLAASFKNLASETTDKKASDFWRLCSAFTCTIKVPRGELSLALFKIFKELEGVLFYALGDTRSPVLGMQQNVDRLLVNMLCYTHQPNDAGAAKIPDEASGFAVALEELNQLHQPIPVQLSSWLQTSIQVLEERLQHCVAILSEEALHTDESVTEFLEEVALLKRLLILAGVHGVRENIEEVERYLRESVTSDTMKSCATSLQLVEQQLLYQFDFPDDSGESTGTEEVVPAVAVNHAEDFGTRCNLCIDVIQQSLDTALGSSGNLIPDSSVVNALTRLNDIVAAEGLDELSNLLTPLSQLLVKAQDSTLNQSDTLLVQEAIIAATLGIDSLVGDKPMPDLVGDVTSRVDEVLQSTSQRLSNRPPPNRSLNSFLVDAEEVLPRLFELFQRLRVAPEGASRLYGDINRLLHAFKYSAEEAEESELAALAHYIESTMVDLTQSEATPSQSFFDLAIESIESLGEDIESLRNSEPAGDRSDLIDRLKVAGAVAPVQPGLRKPVLFEGTEENTAALFESEPEPKIEPEPEIKHKQEPELKPELAREIKLSEKQTGAVPLYRSDLPSANIDWSERFRKVEACYSAIGNSHRQLLELQKKTERIMQTAGAESLASSSESTAELHAFAQQLRQITENQSSAVRQLNRELGDASLLDASSLEFPLFDAVDKAADSFGLAVRFAFDSDHAVLHRNLFNQLFEAISVLVNSVLDSTVSAAGLAQGDTSKELATVRVTVRQTESTTIVDVSDDGCGVVVQSTPPRSDNPWAQVARPDWREIEDRRYRSPPTVWSKQKDQAINIAGLLRVATKYGGTMAVSSSDEQTTYRLCLPVLESTQNVLVFAVRSHLFAISAIKVANVGFTDNDSAVSLGSLLGISKQNTIDKASESHSIAVRNNTGVQNYSVEKIVGHKSLNFTSAERILPDVPGYLGVSSGESEQPVMLLDIDYWNAQQR